ncbi:MAG TPA: hypothetical protein PKO20_07815 [Clostridiales bacterium]|jgi:hypothetical protein|nr:hypothetical protein [Clostridiales bacterium]HOJ35880.1 hypothetical protein [Clostridiales bacterium]HOL79558.1 hypothetical protein [Clostridiales bacterium]HPU67458.1 hypothetical protein [Clostridiales bacterium]HQD73469.1 hypothetical protein [Clostridiales bacterium]
MSNKIIPTVIVPGIGQSKVDLIDDNGNKTGSAWPLHFDTEALIKDIKGSLMKMMILRRDAGFTDKLLEFLGKATKPIACDNEGNKVMKCRVVSYPQSVKDCSPEDRAYIYRMVPLEALGEVIGEENLYFFAFDAFVAPYENARLLDEFIQMVKKNTGSDKVNLVAVSLGGAVSVAYLDAYGHKGDIHRVVNFVAALDGSRIAGDIFTGRVDLESLDSFLAFLIGGNGGKVADLMKLLPKDVPKKLAQKLLLESLPGFLSKSLSMLSLIPLSQYEEAREKWLMGEEAAYRREMSDKYQNARRNYRDTVKKLEAQGVKFFNLCGYGLPLIDFIESKNESSDAVINISSTSIGATSAPVGETFPDGYTPANPDIENAEQFISPDRTIDATTCLLPERTWFFRNQVHDDIAYNDVALEIAKKILSEDEFDSVFSDPRYPQFNGSRNIRKIKYNLMPKAKSADRSKLSPEQVQALDEAIAYTEAMLANTIIVDNSEAKKAEEKLQAALAPLEEKK